MPHTSDTKKTALSTRDATYIQYIGLGLITFVILFGTQIVFGNVMTGANLQVLAMNMVFEGIMALGMTLVIISGGIDLSVSSVFAFGEILAAKLVVQAGLPTPAAVAITLLACAAIGGLNGVLTIAFRVHPLIITLGTQLTLRGVNLAITGGKSVSGLPDDMIFLGQGTVFGVPIPICFFIVSALVLGVLAAHHRFFRQAYVIGGSERGGLLSGINAGRVKIILYMICAVMAGAAGIMAAGTYGAANWAHGNLSELKAIAAVAIGGTNINGGSGTILGTVLGTTFLAVVHNAFVTSAVNPFLYDIFTGAMLLLAVFLNRIIERRNIWRILRVKQAKLDQLSATR